MFFRDLKQIFKPNINFTTKRGFVYTSLNKNDKFEIKVINVLPQQDKEDEKLDLHKLYQKYQQLVQQKKDTVSILQYFEVDDTSGEDSETHLCVVQQQLQQIKEKYGKDWGFKNVNNQK